LNEQFNSLFRWFVQRNGRLLRCGVRHGGDAGTRHVQRR
jgi:hypothetical protein